uniref:Uncharacterized protein n=1 Tax=Rhizophora mucronata TaxID=61149 RepID=A0A2P2MZP7_RHIMU
MLNSVTSELGLTHFWSPSLRLREENRLAIDNDKLLLRSLMNFPIDDGISMAKPLSGIDFDRNPIRTLPFCSGIGFEEGE